MPDNQISPEGKAEAEAELEHRTKVKRPEIVAVQHKATGLPISEKVRRGIAPR